MVRNVDDEEILRKQSSVTVHLNADADADKETLFLKNVIITENWAFGAGGTSIPRDSILYTE